MKKAIFLMCCLITIMFTQASGREKGDFGIGLTFGNPTGIVVKLWNSKKTALDAGLTVETGLEFHVDYLWHNYNIITAIEGKLPVHYGFGIGTGLNKQDPEIYIRCVFGVSDILEEKPFDLFFEISPVLKISTFNSFSLIGTAGFIYYLK